MEIWSGYFLFGSRKFAGKRSGWILEGRGAPTGVCQTFL
jgi:hypothetical protein